jgi:prepilin-type processing-associated H-X9-DG protein
MTASGPPRRAFSMVELLLVLGIAAVLLLLFVPAVQKAREGAARAACQNNLRHLGAALLRFHDQKGVFPTAGGYHGEPDYLVQTGPAGGPWGDGCRAGVGYPGRLPDEQPGSWAYSVWPYLDPNADRSAPSGGRGVGLPVLLCPARGRPALQTVPDRDPVYADFRYAAFPEGGGSWGKTDYACNGLALPPRGAGLLRIAGMGDGLASTVLVGEKALDPQAYATGGWHWDGPAFAGGLGTSRTGTLVVRDQADPERSPTGLFANNWGSAHPCGGHFLFADGSVRVRAHGSGGATLLWLMTPNHPGPADPDADAQ